MTRTTLRLLGVTIGTNQFTTELGWHRLARRVLPARYQRHIPRPQTGSCGFHNGATYWFELRDARAATHVFTTMKNKRASLAWRMH